MSVKDSTVTHKVDIPHESGEWIEFRELGWKTLDAAREVKARNSLLSFRDLGPEFLKSLTSKADDETSVETENPGDAYDMSAVLRASVVAWSYTAPCNEANVDNLDPTTAKWAYEEIIKIHFPTEEEVGKVSEPSSLPSVEVQS